MQITTVGLDLAKRIFQVHAVDTSGGVVLRKALRRSQVLPFFSRLPSCLIGMEACGTSHHWARELTKLGHEVRLMPPIYVKPYAKRGKNDAVDAEAICEAVTRPTMRFVSMKSADQQAALSLHRTRNLLIKQRTQLVNMIRSVLAEFGVNIPEGLERALGLARKITLLISAMSVLCARRLLGHEHDVRTDLASFGHRHYILHARCLGFPAACNHAGSVRPFEGHDTDRPPAESTIRLLFDAGEKAVEVEM